MRKNVGGRPKKQKIEGKLPRAYSGQRRKEFEAPEKLLMIKQIKTFERVIAEEFSEESKDRRAQRLNEVVTREVPATACPRTPTRNRTPISAAPPRPVRPAGGSSGRTGPTPVP